MCGSQTLLAHWKKKQNGDTCSLRSVTAAQSERHTIDSLQRCVFCWLCRTWFWLCDPGLWLAAARGATRAVVWVNRWGQRSVLKETREEMLCRSMYRESPFTSAFTGKRKLRFNQPAANGQHRSRSGRVCPKISPNKNFTLDLNVFVLLVHTFVCPFLLVNYFSRSISH